MPRGRCGLTFRVAAIRLQRGHREGTVLSWGKLLVVAALIAGVSFVFTRTSDPVSSGAKARLSAIMRGLDRGFAMRHLCTREGPFPHGTGVGGPECRRCEDLASAGLLERSEAPDSTQQRHRWIYPLTPKADRIYTTDEDPFSSDKSPRFCFGRTKVHHIAAAQLSMLIGYNHASGVEYVIEAIDPRPLVFSPEGAVLGLPKPVGDNPKLFAPQVTTVMFRSYWAADARDPGRPQRARDPRSLDAALMADRARPLPRLAVPGGQQGPSPATPCAGAPAGPAVHLLRTNGLVGAQVAWLVRVPAQPCAHDLH